MLRVNNTHELFAAVETLTHSVPLRGERLAIITNGAGPALMAVDTLFERGGQLIILLILSVMRIKNVTLQLLTPFLIVIVQTQS